MKNIYKEGRPVMAAYFNMALRNLRNVVIDIQKKVEKGDPNINDGELLKASVIKRLARHIEGKRTISPYQPELLDMAIKMFFQKIKFLAPLREAISLKDGITEAEWLKTNFSEIYTILLKYRNLFTHYDPKNSLDEIQSYEWKAVWLLQKCIEGGRREVKTRFNFSEQDMAFLTGHDIGEAKQREPIDEQGHNQYGNRRRSAFKFIDREDFRYNVRKNKFDGQNRTTHLSDVGIVMFCCLFLERKYISEFTQQIGLFNIQFQSGKNRILKRPDDKEKKIMREILAYYRILTPRPRVESTRPEYALALDIFNELQKAPIELFDTFSPDDQAKFRIVGDNDSETLMVRHRDRFPYFVMRYIDDNRIFTKIRFQMSLGKYRFKFYEKQCIDSSDKDRIRSLQKEVNGFGRFDEIEQFRKERYAHLLTQSDIPEADTIDSKPYLTNQQASYLYNGNRIGLWWGDNCFLPEITADKAECRQPLAWLSFHEMPAMMFHYILSNSGFQTQEIIINYVKNLKDFFLKIADGTITPDNYSDYLTDDITINRLPEKIREYLLGNVPVVDEDSLVNDINDKYEKMVEEAKILLKRFDDDCKRANATDNKFGKKSFVTIKPGRLASWLAKDIVALQFSNEKGDNKLTGLNYQVMQSAIAQWESADAVRRIFENANLLSGDYSHPFLAKAMAGNPKSTAEFYRAYLKQRSRKDWEVTFFRPNRLRNQERTPEWYKCLATRYAEQPIDLPRSLFDNAIRRCLVNNHIDIPKRANVAFLIKRYLSVEMADANQLFYDSQKYRRSYKLFNILFGHRERNKILPNYYSIDEMIKLVGEKGVSLRKSIENHLKQFGNIQKFGQNKADDIINDERQKIQHAKSFYCDNEKQIRRFMTQDIILYILARKVIISQPQFAISEANIFLRDITPDAKENILNMNLPVSITVKLTANKQTFNTVITHPNLKIKNIGDFYSLIYDSRLSSLVRKYQELKNINSNVKIEFDYQRIEKEFENFDHTRIDVFKIIHSLERSIIEDNPNIPDDDHNNFRALLGDGKRFSETEIDELADIRNAFSHNHYNVSGLPNTAELPEIAKVIGKKAEYISQKE